MSALRVTTVRMALTYMSALRAITVCRVQTLVLKTPALRATIARRARRLPGHLHALLATTVLHVGLFDSHAIQLLCWLLLPTNGHAERDPRRPLLCGLLLLGRIVHCHTARLLCWLLLPTGFFKRHSDRLLYWPLLPCRLIDSQPRWYLFCRPLLPSGVLQRLSDHLSNRFILPCSSRRANSLPARLILSR
jgi:hypothetical protein